MFLSEAEELFELARITITSLFRVASIIRNSSPRDRFARALACQNTPLDPTLEIRHVQDKFPLLARTEKEWLSTRLGIASSQRRVYLRYARGHQQRLESHPPDMANSISTDDTAMIELTTASTFSDCTISLSEPEHGDNHSEVSTAATSLGSRDDSYMHYPSLARVSRGAIEFTCPLCCLVQSRLTESSWKKHMYADLRPYVCTFPDCDLKLYPDPTSWFQHEAVHHRCWWQCPLCTTGEFRDESQLRSHLRLHISNSTETQIEILEGAARRVEYHYSTSDCPFCDVWEARIRNSGIKAPTEGPIKVPPSQFEEHDGSHMRQLALFAFPREYMEEAETSSADSNTDIDVNANDGNEDSTINVSDQVQKGHSDGYSDYHSILPDLNTLLHVGRSREGLSSPSPVSRSGETRSTSIDGGHLHPPPFIFRIDEIRENPTVAALYDSYEAWLPSTDDCSNERVQKGATGIWWFCDGQKITKLPGGCLPDEASHYRTYSVYYSNGVGFQILRGDATNPAPDEIWKHLAFKHDDIDYSSRLIIAGSEKILRVQRFDQQWPNVILSSIYQARPIATNPGWGDLKGDLSIFLALLSFSMDQSHVPFYLPLMFVDGRWAVHNLPHGRIHQRGVVVDVYTCPPTWSPPDSNASALQDYEDGIYGKYYN